ncbi:MAG TPA: DUF4129 domain-containing protein, partial [Bacillota bacterium]|nr:DUF4129 domain-containing protein [Bacillota bacterium]
MSYPLPNPDQTINNRALSPVLLTGIFSAVFTLSLMIVFTPQFFQTLLGPTLAGIIGLVLIYSTYAWMSRDLQLPFIFHLLVFLLFQWLGLFRTCLELGKFPAGMARPFLLIGKEPWWFAATLSGGLITFYLNSSLLFLQRFPKTLSPNRREIFIENLHLSMGPWEQNWKSWRFGIFGAMIFSAISYMAGYGWLDLKRFALWAGILFWLQCGLGVWLILIGRFYYKRALWKSVALTPDPETKRVWSRGLAVWFGLGALISLFLPVNWRFNQWWLVQFLLSPAKFLMGGDLEKPPQLSNNSITSSGMPPADSSWIKELFIFLYYAISFSAMLAGLLMVLTLIGGIIHRFFAKEGERLKGLPKALVKLYLFWRDWWRGLTRGLGRRIPSGSVPGDTGTEKLNDPAGKFKKGYSFGHGPRAVIRRGYYRLIHSARLNGYGWRPDQTPREIAQDLNLKLPESEEALTGITDSYQQARYGPKPPTGGLARLFERLRREVQNRLQFLK